MSLKEAILVLIKPSGVQRKLVGEVISRFEKRGFNIEEVKMITPSKELIREHYREHSQKIFFEDLVENMTSGSVVAMKLIGNVEVGRKITGSYIPWEAEKGTIRGDFCCSIRDNIVHCSDSLESSKREIELWFSK